MSLSFVNNYNVWSGGLPNRNGSSSDSYDFTALGYGIPNYSISGNIDYTIGNNFMVSARAGYFFLGTTNKLDPSLGQHQLRPQYYFTLGNATIIDVPADIRRPTGWQSRSIQSMTYPFEMDEESNFSAGVDFTYFLNLAGEHAWKAGVAFTRAAVNKTTMWNGPPGHLLQLARRHQPTPLARQRRSPRRPPFPRQRRFPGTPASTASSATSSSNRLALYLQDSWTIANGFTLNFGVRLESGERPQLQR